MSTRDSWPWVYIDVPSPLSGRTIQSLHAVPSFNHKERTMSRRTSVVGILCVAIWAWQGDRIWAQAVAEPAPKKQVTLTEHFAKFELGMGTKFTVTVVRTVHWMEEVDYYLDIRNDKTSLNLWVDDAADLVALLNSLDKQRKPLAKEVDRAVVKVAYPEPSFGFKKYTFAYDLTNGKLYRDYTQPDRELPAGFREVLAEAVKRAQKLKAVPPSVKF
jgi:hypothetical protein